MRYNIIRLLIYFFIASGFTLESLIGWSEYFKYETATHVSILNFPKEIVIPTLVLGAVRKRRYMPINKIFELKLFDNVAIVDATFSSGKCAIDLTTHDGDLPLSNEFIKGDNYYLSIKSKERRLLKSHDIIQCSTHSIFQIFLSLNINHQQLADRKIFVDLISYDSDFDVPSQTPSICFKDPESNYVDYYLSYSISISKLSPPPYDTGCFNYSKRGFSSQDNCINQCLKNITMKHHFLVDKLVIDKDQFQNSSMFLLPAFYQSGNENLTERDLKDQFRRITQYLTRPLLSEEEMEKFFPKFQLAINGYTSCREYCRQPDCLSEMLTPNILYIREKTFPNFNKNNQTQIDLQLFSPNQPVILVESGPKIDSVSFIAYVLSTFGFWFGLNAIEIAEKLCRLATLLSHFLRNTDNRITRKTTPCRCNQDILTLVNETRYHISHQIRQQNQIIRQHNEILKQLCKNSNLRVYRICRK